MAWDYVVGISLFPLTVAYPKGQLPSEFITRSNGGCCSIYQAQQKPQK